MKQKSLIDVDPLNLYAQGLSGLLCVGSKSDLLVDLDIAQWVELRRWGHEDEGEKEQ
jgi:hypothetical protein